MSYGELLKGMFGTEATDGGPPYTHTFVPEVGDDAWTDPDDIAEANQLVDDYLADPSGQ